MFCYKVNAIICRKVSHMSLKSEQLFHCDCVGRFLYTVYTKKFVQCARTLIFPTFAESMISNHVGSMFSTRKK